MIGRVAVVGAVGMFVLAGCSNSPPTSHNSSTATSASAAGQGDSGQGTGGLRGPAASGTIAAVSGKTMQVQNPQTGQVAVTWTSSTKFTHQIATTLAAIKTGDCVTALAPSGTSFDATSFTATSLMVSPSGCNIRIGPGPTGRPSGFASGARPSGLPSGQLRGGAVASGKVTSVAGNTVVIAAQKFGGSGTSNKTVTVTSSTKITTEAATTATSVKVGKCVTAEGKADSTGAVTATRVRITDPMNGQCGAFRRIGDNGG
jgi:hypothetical protein